MKKMKLFAAAIAGGLLLLISVSSVSQNIGLIGETIKDTDIECLELGAVMCKTNYDQACTFSGWTLPINGEPKKFTCNVRGGNICNPT